MLEVADIADSLPEGIYGSGAGSPQMGFEFGEGHLDGIEIGAVGRREEEPRAACFEDGFGFFAFVTGEIVEDNDVAGIECGSELGFDIGFEGHAVHWAIDDPWCGQAITAQRSDECLGFPVTGGSARFQALVAPCPSAQSRHLGRGRRFINEDKMMRLPAQAGLPINTPSTARLGNIIASAFRCQQRFF